MAGVFGRSITPSAQRGGQWSFGGAIAVSVLLHALVAVALTGIADWRMAEPEVTAMTVDLMPPPEPEKPVPEKPEPEESEPEESEQEESEQEEAEQDSAESVASNEQPPRPPAQEQDQQHDQPPTQQQAQQQDQPQTEEPPARSPPDLPVLQPVIEFGETDSGLRTEPGDRSRQALEAPEPDEPEPEPEAVKEAEAATDEPGEVGPVAAPAVPKPRPVRNPATAAPDPAEPPEEMVPAKQLYSAMMLSDPRVQTAMADTPRAERGKLLCMTEMRGQLLAASPPRRPEILPSFALPAGTVLEQRQAAFRSGGQWFDLAFRCEVDQPVTKVLSFSYRIGKAIPRQEWSQRGFPGL